MTGSHRIIVRQSTHTARAGNRRFLIGSCKMCKPDGLPSSPEGVAGRPLGSSSLSPTSPLNFLFAWERHMASSDLHRIQSCTTLWFCRERTSCELAQQHPKRREILPLQSPRRVVSKRSRALSMAWVISRPLVVITASRFVYRSRPLRAQGLPEFSSSSSSDGVSGGASAAVAAF